MSRLFSVYRVLAFVVGALLVVLTAGVILEYGTAHGSSPQRLGEQVTFVVGVTHGWLYMAYVVVAFLLARRARWTIGFTLLMLAAGLIPLLIFWVERRVAEKVRSETPELAGV